jgi:adenosylcobinamide-phosphate synthase
MSLLSLIIALLLEQWRPLSGRRYLLSPLGRLATWLERHFNAGESQHGLIAWLVGVGPIVLGTWLVYALLWRMNFVLALAFNVLALYLTMGFRQFSHHFTDIHLALKQDDLESARRHLAAWRGHSCANLNPEEVVRLTIEEALAASHRNVFAVIFWFVILPGPSGAILYRLTTFFHRRWGGSADGELGRFGLFAGKAFAVMEWLPARFTASAFAIVGDFEDAIFCWRSQAAKWMDPVLGIVIASGAGALGVKLGMPYVQDGEIVERPEMGTGDDADVSFLDSTIGLVWRALVLWLVLLLVLGVAAIL